MEGRRKGKENKTNEGDRGERIEERVGERTKERKVGDMNMI